VKSMKTITVKEAIEKLKTMPMSARIEVDGKKIQNFVWVYVVEQFTTIPIDGYVRGKTV
jgi:hypothetical protein